MRALLLLVLIQLAACATTHATAPSPASPTSRLTSMPTPENPYAPRPGDSSLRRGQAFVGEAGVLTLESSPPQFQLHLSGNLPDPCHELRIVVNPPDDGHTIAVEAYSVADPSMLCIQVLKAFSADVSLGSLPAGHYTLTINGESAAEFDS